MGKGSGKGSKQVTPYNSSGKTTVITVTKPSYKTGTLTKRAVDQSQAYGTTTRIRYEDKQSGSYGRYTRKEKVSSGEVHVEKGTGQVGVKDEFTKSSTIRIGNKRGYTEYHTEERFRDVKYGKTSNNQTGLIECQTQYEDNHDYGHDDTYECGSGYGYDDCYDDY